MALDAGAGTTDIGTGSTITFGTSGYSAELLNIAWSDFSRESVGTAHMGSTPSQSFMPGDLYDGGTLTLEFHFKTNEAVPITGAAETMTVTFPIVTAADAATWACSGFVTGFEFTDPLEDKMVATMTVKLTGDVTQPAA